MVHGNPAWSFMYRHLVDGLRDRFRVVVPDHIGCGLSDHPGGEGYSYTLEQRARDLEQLLDALQLDQPVSLVVHDWGGLIGCAYAIRCPSRISRMVVLNTAAFHLPPGKDLNRILRWCRSSRLAAFMILRLNFFSWAATNLGMRMRRMPRLVRKAYRYPYCNARDRQAVLIRHHGPDVPGGRDLRCGRAEADCQEQRAQPGRRRARQQSLDRCEHRQPRAGRLPACDGLPAPAGRQARTHENVLFTCPRRSPADCPAPAGDRSGSPGARSPGTRRPRRPRWCRPPSPPSPRSGTRS